MIAAVEAILRDLLLRDVASLAPTGGSTTTAQVRFQPPDEKWQTYVSNLVITTPAGSEHVNALNVYLVDVRENRRLRTNERERSYSATGLVEEEPAPLRVDCHYLITAWSPAQETPAVEPALDEHALLADVAAVLAQHAPLNPSRIYPPASPQLAGVPALIRDADLPAHVLPAEGFPKLGEFWSAMGARGRWKPGVYFIVTVPVQLSRRVAGPPVTTLTATYSQNGHGSETLVDIGGRTLDDTSGDAVPGAFVRLLDAAGASVFQSVDADGEGRFRFDRLVAGTYRLQAGAPGVGSADRKLDVPSPTGEYDLRLA